MLNPATKEAYQLLHDGALALTRCEQWGMRVDVDYIKKQQYLIDDVIENLENEFKRTKFYKDWKKSVKGELNIYSDKQLGHFIYNVAGFKVEKRTTKGNPSTDNEALQDLNIPDLEPYLQIGKYRTLKNTFLKGLERETVNGVMRPFFHLHLPVTYRGSSSDPNFQNQPKRDPEQMQIIRGAIYPSKGHQLMELDYSQIEVRVAAAYHQDPTMLKYIKDKTTDMHRDMSQQIFMIKKWKDEKDYAYLRNATKNSFVFPSFYGDYHVGFAKSFSSSKWLKLPTYGKWKDTNGVKFKDETIAAHLIKNGIDHLGLPTYENGSIKTQASGFTKHLQEIEKHFWNKRFPVYNQWKEDFYQEYLEKGYFYNKTGFTFQGVMNKKDCINYPVQSSAFHVLLWSLIQAVKAMQTERWKTRIIGQIHDAIVFDLHPSERDHVINVMKCIMTNDVLQHWEWINVPLEIECELCPVNAPWSMKEKFNIH
jgi:DNA polymerase I-like protein with 3'-5' exonuclease and polymerase domains